MKKNILLLINGFGIEQKDSYDIYSPLLMPNMDKLTKEGLFSSLDTKDLDYKSGYRCFSIGINEPLTYTQVENSITKEEYKRNIVLQNMYSNIQKSQSKLHIFCYWDNKRTIEQLKYFIKDMTLYIKSNIFIHLILTHKSLDDCNNLQRYFNSLIYDLPSNIKVGIVAGEDYLATMFGVKDFIKSLVTEAGEKWKDIGKKIEVLKQTKTPPSKCRTFSINGGYSMSNNDFILYFNYTNIDVNQIEIELKNQKYKQLNVDSLILYSLFPVKLNNKNVPYMYNYAISSTSFSKSLSDINITCMLMDKQEKCKYINYYLTGLQNVYSQNIKYMMTDDDFIYDKSRLIGVLNQCKENIIIINYDITSCKKIDDIENELKKIDEMIGLVLDYVNQNKYALFISSLYGIQKEMMNNKSEVHKINFSSRVPVVFYDPTLIKSKYYLDFGTTFDLANAILKNTNEKHTNSGILKKKKGWLSFLFKKGNKK